MYVTFNDHFEQYPKETTHPIFTYNCTCSMQQTTILRPIHYLYSIMNCTDMQYNNINSDTMYGYKRGRLRSHKDDAIRMQ